MATGTRNQASIVELVRALSQNLADAQGENRSKFDQMSAHLDELRSMVQNLIVHGSNEDPRPPCPITSVLSKTPRAYSAAEMADRIARGLCMFCDEPFIPGHQLKHKRTRLFVMELDEEETNDDEPEVAEELPRVQNEEVSEAQSNEDGEIAVGKDEESKDYTILSDDEMQMQTSRTRHPGRPPRFRGVRGPGRPRHH